MSHRPVAFYIHHQGAGHVTRAAALARSLGRPSVGISSSDVIDSIGKEAFTRFYSLPLDYDPSASAPEAHDSSAPDCFHYAPVPSRWLLERTAELVSILKRENPLLLIVDVSVEVTLLARLCGIPTIVVRQHGRRTDNAHRAAYDSAEMLLAPFPKAMEDPITPASVKEKSIYFPSLSKHAVASKPSPENIRSTFGIQPSTTVGVIVLGRGGRTHTLDQFITLATWFGEIQWYLLGVVKSGSELPIPDNLHVTGWTKSTIEYFAIADFVVGSAGNNSVMEVAEFAVPYIVVPENRPFEEQVRKAEVLTHLGLAHVLSSYAAPQAEWSTAIDFATSADSRKCAIRKWTAIARSESQEDPLNLLKATIERLDRKTQ